MSRLTAIICAVVICLLLSMVWAINHYRDNAITYKDQRVKAIEQLTLANATIKDMQTRQRGVAALDAKYTKELADAKVAVDILGDLDCPPFKAKAAAPHDTIHALHLSRRSNPFSFIVTLNLTSSEQLNYRRGPFDKAVRVNGSV